MLGAASPLTPVQRFPLVEIFLLNLRLAEKAIFIEGVGGIVFLEEEGDYFFG
jgi:hypothetical protein